VGPFVTFVFENRETVRFHIQEMARAEALTSDRAIQAELDTYNPLIPGPGELVATMFIELTSKPDLEQWLPKLVGIERAVSLQIGDGVVAAIPDDAHAELLTREQTTASVHYLRFRLGRDHIARFPRDTVHLAVEHSKYAYATELAETV